MQYLVPSGGLLQFRYSRQIKFTTLTPQLLHQFFEVEATVHEVLVWILKASAALYLHLASTSSAREIYNSFLEVQATAHQKDELVSRLECLLVHTRTWCRVLGNSNSSLGTRACRFQHFPTTSSKINTGKKKFNFHNHFHKGCK